MPYPQTSGKGSPGKDGIPGEDGAPGTAGVNGKDGAPGVAGAPGKDGLNGKDGAAGSAGIDGLPGRDGVNGKDGAPGTAGKDGAPGAPGAAGVNGKDGATGVQGKDGVNGSPGTPGTSFAPQTPVARALTIGNPLQHTDTTKAFKVVVNVRATQTLTVAGLSADKLELRVGPNAAAVAAGGSGGFSLAVWESGITGIALMIGAGIQDGGQLFADVPAGWYFQVNRLSGTASTIVNCFTQSMSA